MLSSSNDCITALHDDIRALQKELKAKNELLERILHRAYEAGWSLEASSNKSLYDEIDKALKGNDG